MVENEIGGYFELEIDSKSSHYHEAAFKFNSFRSGLRAIVEQGDFKKVFVPSFTCDVVSEPLLNAQVQQEFYHVGDTLEPTAVPEVKENELFIYNNYFGLKTDYINQELIKSIPTRSLLIDNAQAFFVQPVRGVNTIYSPRKFFGVPDGAYVYSELDLTQINYPRARSYERFSHLLMRLDEGATAGYGEFQLNEEKLRGLPVEQMSLLTEKILSSIDYESVRERRMSNFSVLHTELGSLNLMFDLCDIVKDPFTYPLRLKHGSGLRSFLISRGVFSATYWPRNANQDELSDVEIDLVTNIVHLPIDHRYGAGDMLHVVGLVIEYLKDGD